MAVASLARLSAVVQLALADVSVMEWRREYAPIKHFISFLALADVSVMEWRISPKIQQETNQLALADVSVMEWRYAESLATTVN